MTYLADDYDEYERAWWNRRRIIMESYSEVITCQRYAIFGSDYSNGFSNLKRSCLSVYWTCSTAPNDKIVTRYPWLMLKSQFLSPTQPSQFGFLLDATPNLPRVDPLVFRPLETIQPDDPIIPGLYLYYRDGRIHADVESKIIAMTDWRIPAVWLDLDWTALINEFDRVNQIPVDQLQSPIPEE